jgi:hypothetical protein
MKRNIFIAVLGMGASLAAYGQGQINFSNYLTGPSDPIITHNGQGLGSEYLAGLAYYVGTSALDVPTSLGQMTIFNFSDTAGDSAPVAFGLGAGGVTDGSKYSGWYNGGTVTVPGITSANNTFVSFEVLAYNGASYASSAISGHSAIFQAPVTGSATAQVGGFAPGAWNSFTVTTAAVPEPTTLALAGLGGLASLVALRRKQA